MRKLFLIALLTIVMSGCLFVATLTTSFDKKDKDGKIHKVDIVTTIQSDKEVEVTVIIDENVFYCGVHYGKEDQVEKSVNLKDWEDFKLTGEIEVEINGVSVKCSAKKT